MKSPIAFFCAEYALGEDEGMYAGGLGVLAADFLFESADLGLPLIAIGMRYSNTRPPQELGFELVRTNEGKIAEVVVPFEEEDVRLRAWIKRYGESVLYLLDTSVEGNSREVLEPGSLYDPHFYTRFRQQVFIGIGGYRLLKLLGIRPHIYHVNEGNMAFAALAVMAEEFSEGKLNRDELIAAVRERVVATKHTILSAGTKITGNELWRAIGRYASAYGLTQQLLMSLGGREKDPDIFAATRFLLKLSGRSNAVSAIHAIFEKERYEESELIAITNGVYCRRWRSPLWGNGSVEKLVDKELWQTKSKLRQNLVEAASKVSGVELNPEAATIVWTRRFVPYKRPLLVFEDPARLAKILSDPKRPAQIIISGKVYEAEEKSRGIEAKVKALAADPVFRGRVAYVPGYTIARAQLLVAGADIWLNTPLRGQEACGTSGMKAGLNGALQMSISDGWIDEVNWKGIGWKLAEEHTASSIYEALEREALPAFYERKGGVPIDWVTRLRKTIELVERDFTTERALRDYEKKLYLSNHL